MQHADYVHLVRLSEHASAENAAAYRRGLAAFAGLGYAWVVGCLLAAAATLWWIAGAVLRDGFQAVLVVASIGAAGLLWNSGRALWCRLDAPPGLRLKPSDAPALFMALERIRLRVKGPPVHEVRLDDQLRARITQRPRWGLFGGARNHLTIGLPLLMALDRHRFLAVLAHEYGHLRGDHGRFAAWIYRTRASWNQLYQQVRDDPSRLGAATQGFLAWYFPRFVARTFALARQDEYEADRISARLLGGEVAAAALTETALKEDWLRQCFWPDHWALAADHAHPVGPFRQLASRLAQPLPEDFARHSLRMALRRTSGLDDTHPGLKERLEGLGLQPHVPAWSCRAAIDLLGEQAPSWIAHFDERWCRDNAVAWRQHHAALGRLQARVAELEQRRDKGAGEWTELGDLRHRLQPHVSVRAEYAQALALQPQHGNALRGLYGCLAHHQFQQRLACLERLHEASPQHRWWAARQAMGALEECAPAPPGALELWRARLLEAQAAEARAWSELTQQPFLEGTEPPDLSGFERRELEAELARWPDVRCAWLLRRPLHEFPGRRCYLLVVDLPRLQERQALHLCRALEPCLWLPGPVLLLWAGQSPELADPRRMGRPVYDTRVLV